MMDMQFMWLQTITRIQILMGDMRKMFQGPFIDWFPKINLSIFITTNYLNIKDLLSPIYYRYHSNNIIIWLDIV